MAADGDPAAGAGPDVEAHALLRASSSSSDEDPEQCAFEPAEKIVVSIAADPDADEEEEEQEGSGSSAADGEASTR